MTSPAPSSIGAADFDLDRPVGTLTIGQRQIVEIARLIARDARILILDEPTATLSDVEIGRIFAALKALKAEGRSVIYITHRLGEVFEICDSATVLRNGAHIVTVPSSAIDRDGPIEHMLGRKLDGMYPSPHVTAQGQPPLVVHQLSIPGAVRDFSMTAKRGEILYIAGQIGSGAHRVVRALAGLDAQAEGRVAIAGKQLQLGSVPACVKRGIFFISEDRAGEGVFLNRSALENLIALKLPQQRTAGILSWRRLRTIGRTQAARVSVDRSKINALARELSGGNQQKLLFGRAVEAKNSSVRRSEMLTTTASPSSRPNTIPVIFSGSTRTSSRQARLLSRAAPHPTTE